MDDDENRSIDEGGIITIKKMGLYEVSFVKEPLHPSWTVKIVEPEQPYLLMDYPGYAEYAKGTQEWEEIYNVAAWKKANDEFFKKIFDRPFDKKTTHGDPFRKQSLEEVKKGLHDLMKSIWLYPITFEREFDGRWKDE